MKQIEINTTQNVVIQYQLASVGERIVAYFLDLIIMLVTSGLLSWALSYVLPSDYVFYFVAVPIFLFYTLLLENFLNGQTLGKKALELRVIRIYGDEPQLEDLLIRWGFRLVDIYLSSGALAAFLANSSEKNQRLGDMIAGTTVVKLKPPRKYELTQILEIQTEAAYEVTYPEVYQLSEQQMLLVKKTLERYRTYKNAAHEEALLLLGDKICDRLGLERPQRTPAEVIGLLKILLKDYVVLTR